MAGISIDFHMDDQAHVVTKSFDNGRWATLKVHTKEASYDGVDLFVSTAKQARALRDAANELVAIFETEDE